jgi:hypothetical protein
MDSSLIVLENVVNVFCSVYHPFTENDGVVWGYHGRISLRYEGLRVCPLTTVEPSSDAASAIVARRTCCFILILRSIQTIRTRTAIAGGGVCRNGA